MTLDFGRDPDGVGGIPGGVHPSCPCGLVLRCVNARVGEDGSIWSHFAVEDTLALRGSNTSGGDAFDPEALHPRIGVKAARREAETSTPEVPPPKTGLLLVQTSLSEGSCARLALSHTSLSKDLRHCPTLGSHFTIQGPLPMSRIGSHLTT